MAMTSGIAKLWKPVVNVCDLDEGEGFWSALTGPSPTGRHGDENGHQYSSTKNAVAYLIGGGAIYLVLWIYGLVIEKMSAANFVPLNTADDWLHFVLGLGMIGLGVMGRQALRGATANATGR